MFAVGPAVSTAATVSSPSSATAVAEMAKFRSVRVRVGGGNLIAVTDAAGASYTGEVEGGRVQSAAHQPHQKQ